MKFYYNVIRTGVPGMLDKNVLKTAGFEAGDKLEVNVEEGGTRIVITRVKEAFDAHKWASSIHKKYSADYYWAEIGGHRCIAYEKVTPIDRITKFGLAQCHPNDMYDEYVGGAVAICRAEGIPLPSELTSDNIYKK